jgi:hypothetical protein
MYSSWARCRVWTRVGAWLRRRKAARLGRRALQDTGALGAIALAGLKTRHYNIRAWKAQRYGWPSWREMRQWRPSAKVNEHKEERSLERLVDMEVSRKKE